MYMDRQDKNQQIKETLKATKERHSKMNVKTFEVKVVSSKMSKAQKSQINQYFKEAKWLRNYFLSDIDNADCKTNSVVVKVKDEYVTKPLEILGSQVKQDVLKKLKSETKSLNTTKSKGKKIGKLKFKSFCNCISLKQFGTTYKIDFVKNRIKIQNIDKPLYVRGLKQIPNDSEIANANFVRKPDGLYFYITCYIPKEEHIKTNRMVGIDFGIENNLNFSDEREAFNCCLKETKHIKWLSKKINKEWKRNGESHSNNNKKRIKQLKIAYQKLRNQRIDIANKEVHIILNNYDFIAIQDEMIHNWHAALFGKQIQNSCMGTIKMKLKNSSKVFIISKSFPSTQACPICGSLNKHPLDKRSYDCPYCGYHHDSRDKKSAQSILDEALRLTTSLCGAQSSESY